MVHDLAYLINGSFWVWGFTAVALWSLLAALLASRLRVNAALGAACGALLLPLGLVVVAVISQSTRGAARPYAAEPPVPEPQMTGRRSSLEPPDRQWASTPGSWVPASVRLDGPAEKEPPQASPWYQASDTVRPARPTVSPASRVRGIVAGPAAVPVGLLVVCLGTPWLSITPSESVLGSYSGGSSALTLVPVLLSAGIVAGSAVGFLRSPRRRWAALAALASAPWAAGGFQIVLMTDTLGRLLGHAFALRLPVEVSASAHVGAYLLSLGGLTGLGWATAAGVYVHRLDLPQSLSDA
jgi:hypothetical protein